MIDDAVSGEDITSMELAGMIMETVEKNVREVRDVTREGLPLNAVCKEPDDYAKHYAEHKVPACCIAILQDVEDIFRKAWTGT